MTTTEADSIRHNTLYNIAVLLDREFATPADALRAAIACNLRGTLLVVYQRFEQYDTLTARELAADNRVPLTAHYASGLLYDLYTLRLLDREDAGGELVYWRI